MERLTEWVGDTTMLIRPQHGDSRLIRSNYMTKADIDAVRRLAEYEDTGWMPNEIVKKELAATYNKLLDTLSLTNRAINCLHRANINTIGDLLSLESQELWHIRGLGVAIYDDIMQALQKAGLQMQREK